MESNSNWRQQLIPQIALLFFIGVLISAVLTNYLQYKDADLEVRREVEARAVNVSTEVAHAILEYPEYEWLIDYWYKHWDELDIEYDTEYTKETITEEKCRYLSKRYPDIQLDYATEEEIFSMSEEDQKIYAEITYAWVINRLDQIQRSHGMEYLFCVMTDQDYKSQFFLLSAAKEGAVRGTEYEQVYTLGVTVNVSESQSQSMKDAVSNYTHVADAGEYLDCYVYFETLDDHPILIGVTYSLDNLMKTVRARTLRQTGIALALQIILLAICIIIIGRFLLRPLKTIQRNIRIYMNNKDSEQIVKSLEQVRPQNEIGQLSKDVSDLAQEIEQYTKSISAITAEKERINTELTLASRIQLNMLPSEFPAFPDRSEFDIYALMDPAREVGGDFYDFFMIDDDHLCISIADVAGKGIPASLFMMSSKIMLYDNALAGKSPEKILEDTNEAICKHNKLDMFVTVWLGILEISTGKLRAVNAGHEYPIMMSEGGEFELYKDHHGFVVGGIEDITYTEYEMDLKPGSKIFLYTDGVTDAMNIEGEMFGIPRIMESINKDPSLAPRDVIKVVRHDIDLFTRDSTQFDDLTMLCLEYKGKDAKKQNAYAEITVPAKIENLAAVTDFVEEQLEQLDCPIKQKYQINVAIDELFSNISYYAYGDGEGDVTVRFGFDEETRSASVTFMDKGVPFNPLSREMPDTTLPAEERQQGGLGIFMVRKSMDSVNYKYEDGYNKIEIRKVI